MMNIKIPDSAAAPVSSTSRRGKVVVPSQGHFSFTTNHLVYSQEEIIAVNA